MAPIRDIAGQRFGRLIAVHRLPSRQGQTYWHCQCDCGTECSALLVLLNDGRKKSCGCLRREVTGAKKRTHGMAPAGRKPSEYTLWLNMRQRCSNPKTPQWEHYGGRGITVCQRWNDSFEAFYSDMGPRPQTATGSRHRSLYSLDRIDNNGPYSPENCRWATQAQQARNTRVNRRITFNGETLTVTDWAMRLRVDSSLIRHRLNVGWSIHDAMTRPSKRRRHP